jgi:hypothetical protein
MKKTAFRMLTLGSSLLATGIVLEVAARVYKSEYRYTNFLEYEKNLFRAAYPTLFDPELGWVPRPGVSRPDQNAWGTRVTLLEHGIRSNGESEWAGQPARSALLAVGDSFTFGDQVSDDETWPAHLERMLQRRVINGGVFGYGLDQIYLRSVQLLDIFQPAQLVVGIYPDDILRAQLSERSGAQKPYFALDGEDLRLCNVPVPPPRDVPMDPLRRLLGRSFFLHKLMMKIARPYWLTGLWADTPVHDQGEAIACRLVEAWQRLARERGIPLCFVVQYTADVSEHSRGLIERLGRCVHDPGVIFLDLQQALREVRDADPARFAGFYTKHMTAEGNRFVAEQLRAALAPPP